MKHILLLFLSEIHLNSDQTLAISLYKREDGSQVPCVQTNESAVRFTAEKLQHQGEQLDCLFYFSTRKTQEVIHYMDTSGQRYALTHEALFLKRIRPLVSSFIRIDYDEKSQTDESIRQIMEMADSVRSFIANQHWNPEEVRLHADLTGGFRHASMMMLSVMQLLKYRGIQTTEVLYSNRNEHEVEDVTDIYRMFNLVSGADEFVNFGSTREITSYMEGHEQTPETTRLLQTMRDFTNAVRICRTGQIAPLAHQLQNTMKQFEISGAVSLQEKIFQHVLEIFKSEYGSLLTADFNNLDIIHWCVEKGYLQQAMTLCTEWIPSEIVSRHIFYPVAPVVQAECMQKKKGYHTWQHYFLISYSLSAAVQTKMDKAKAPWEELPGKKRASLLRDIVRDFEAYPDIPSIMQKYPEAAPRIRPLLEELKKGKDPQMNLQDLKKEVPNLYIVLHYMYQTASKVPQFKQTEAYFVQKRTTTSIYHYLETSAPYEIYWKIHALAEKATNQKKEEIPQSKKTFRKKIPGIYCSQEKWNNRQQQYLKMVHYGLVDLAEPAKKTLEILHDYFQIREERNHINHANAEDAMSTREVKTLMLNLLRRMQEMTLS